MQDMVFDTSADDAYAGSEIYLGRQPIFTRDGSLSAYELLFRDSAENSASVGDADRATAHVLCGALGDFGVGKVLRNRTGFVNVSRSFLMSDAIETIPFERFVLEILEDIEFDGAVIARCHALHAAGYRLALDDVSTELHVPPQLLAAIDIVKVDMRSTSRGQFANLVGYFLGAGKTVLAEKVETHDDFDVASRAGCQLFQGYFFARAQVLRQRKANHCPASLLRLLGVLSTDPDPKQLEEALKANADIVVHLLRLANANRCADRRREMTSVREAILVVGIARMTRWIHLLIYANGINPSIALDVSPMVQLVGVRARFMELMAQRIAEHQTMPDDFADMASLTGMLSLMNVIFELPFSELMEQLHVHPSIQAAIESHDGPLGTLLAAAEAIEIQDEDVLRQTIERWPSLDRSTLAELQMSAERWIDHWTADQHRSSIGIQT